MKPTLETKDLLLVRAVAREGGVSHAARDLHLSQSAVSHHLTRLEQRLGVELFQRVGRRLTLGPAGARLLALGDELLPKLVAAERELRAPQRMVIRLATQCYTGYQWLPAMTRALEASHPNVALSIRLAATADPLAALEAGELDLALTYTPTKKSRFATTIVGHDEFVLVMAPTHPLVSKTRVRPADLHDHTFFVFDTKIKMLRDQAALTFPKGGAPSKISRIPVTEALVELVRAGQGVSLLSRWMARRYIESGELVTRPLQGANCKRKWRAVHSKTGPLLPALRTLVDFLIANRPMGATGATGASV